MAPMGQLWGLLGVAVPLLMEVGLGGAPSHSLSYLFTVVSEPGPGLPQFMVSGHFDGQLFASYDSERRSGVPRTEWMEEMVELDPGYWDWLNRNARNSEQIFKWQIGTVMRHYNHSGVAPVVKVTHKAGIGGLETLVCHIHGFYPKDIDATWRKDEEVREQETLRGNITPNSDGTYNTWISIEVDEKDRDKYQCHVEHDSLPEGAGSDLDFPVVECGAPILPWIIVGSALVLILIVTLIVIILKKRGSQNAPATNAEMQEMNPPQRRRRICISVAE
ncbi:major histocompatibility complex class I-related gene protein isoform X3 [Anolis carolinensis]|uniref:major histocompatibility complex class I-related gene protein isoform X3 n=1 Tax=Anolis carolinensis TaxID=28377 RepID=UPI002F2B39FA